MPRRLRRTLGPIAVALLLGSPILTACAPRPSEPWTLPPAQLATEPTLLPGDQAPPIVVSAWLRGAPIPASERGVITVVDFWAAWCPPCLGTLPHLARLEELYRTVAPGRVEFVAVTALDRVNSRAAIDALLADPSLVVPSRLAIDAGTTTTEAFRGASRETAIPRAFVIDGDGRLAWLGHPQDVARVIDDLLAGHWDEQAARTERIELLAARRTAQAALDRYLASEQASELASEQTGAIAARDAAVAELATLPVDAVPFAPPWAFRITNVRLLVARGATTEAVAAAAASLDTPVLAGDPDYLIALARAVAPASEADGEEYAHVALATLEGQERADRRPSDDPWLAWLRAARAESFPLTLEAIADYRIERGDRRAAQELLRRAAAKATALGDAEEAKRLERRAAALEANG